jgi:radical SAM protein with 4Fe4S-binding SPASM domain
MGATRGEPQHLIDDAARAALMRAPRPRRDLPIAPAAEPFRRHLPLADTVRAADAIRPIYAVWELTLKCDLACRHCGSRAGQARPDELTTTECLDLVRQMAELGVKEVTVIGGEAYLRDDWTDIVREIRKRGMQATMTTGGRGITEERARAAALAGLQSASVSIDGAEPTHDRLRGVRGSHASAVAALGHLSRAGIGVSVNTQINRLSAKDLHQVLDTIIAAKGHSWQIQLTVAMGRGADEPEVLLQPYDLIDVFPLIAELKRRSAEAGVRLWPGNNIGYFGPYESLLRGGTPQGHHASCGAGRGTLGIEADGTIKGCPSLTTHAWAGGNVREHTLKDIWERASALRYTRDRTVDDLWGFCRTCYYADECRAGCTWTADVLFGRPGNNPYCHHRALELARHGKRERVVQVENAPGRPFDNGRFELVLEDLPQGESP